MAFMQSNGGGDFTPFLSFNAKAGRWYTKLVDGGDLTEVTDMSAVFDFSRLQTGWFLFEAGSAPDKQIDVSLGQAGQKPGEFHKRGFQLLVFSTKNLGGVREFSSTAGVVIDAMNLLHDAYMAAPEREQGKLPVVRCTGVQPVTSKHGTNYQPVMAIAMWVDPPAELATTKLEAPRAAQPPAAAPAPSAPAQHAPPPAAKAPEPVGAGEEMF